MVQLIPQIFLVVVVNYLLQVKLADDMRCHVAADLSGLVFFSTEDFSTSCIQFDLSAFEQCRQADGQFDLHSFEIACTDNPAWNELKQQLITNHFITESK